MKRGHFEHDPIEVLDNNKPKGLKRRMVSNFSNISLKNAAVLPPPSKRSESCGIRHASMTTLDGHSEGQDGRNPDNRATSPPYPCESEVMQFDSRAAEEGKQSGVQQLDNETKNSIADGLDEVNDGGCVLQDLLKDYTSDSAEPSDDGKSWRARASSTRARDRHSHGDFCLNSSNSRLWGWHEAESEDAGGRNEARRTSAIMRQNYAWGQACAR